MCRRGLLEQICGLSYNVCDSRSANPQVSCCFNGKIRVCSIYLNGHNVFVEYGGIIHKGST